jgi:hypothetical protein
LIPIPREDYIKSTQRKIFMVPDYEMMEKLKTPKFAPAMTGTLVLIREEFIGHS